MNPWTVACQATAPLSMGFSRQEYWNGLPFPSPACYLIAIRLQPVPMVSPKGAQNVKNTGYWPQDNWDAYERNDFNKLRLLHLPLHRKVLNSLTWDIWFSLINNNLLMFRKPALYCNTSIYLGFPPHILRAVLSGLLEILPPRLEVLKIPNI